MIGEVRNMELAGVGSFSLWAFATQNAPTALVLLTLVWTLIRIYETETVQKLLGRNKDDEET